MRGAVDGQGEGGRRASAECRQQAAPAARGPVVRAAGRRIFPNSLVLVATLLAAMLPSGRLATTACASRGGADEAAPEAPAAAAVGAARPPTDPQADPEAGVENQGDDALPAAMVRVRLPLRGGVEVLEQTLLAARDRLLEQARERRDPRRPLLVVQIAPAPGAIDDGAGSDFESAFAVADLLSSRALNDVKTVAWAPQTIRGHGALLAIACEELAMHPDAEIGDAGVDEPDGRAMRRAVVEAYREIAEARRTIAAPLAVAMIDPAAEVVKVETEGGVEFILAEQLPALRAERDVIDSSTLVPAGTLARFTGREGRQYGFVRYLAADKDALAAAYGVDPRRMIEDASLATAWKAVLIDLSGEVTSQRVDEIRTLVDSEIVRGMNWIGLRIDSAGGDLAACIDLANYLAGLDANAVRTVAYVPVEARGGAALVALACDHLVMHPQAAIGAGPPSVAAKPPAGPPGRRPPLRPGGPQPAPPGRDDASSPEKIAAAVVSIRESLAVRSERDWSLLAAMIDPGSELLEFRDKATGRVRVLSPAQAETLPEAARWTRGAPVGRPNERLAISGRQAESLGIARHVVDSYDQLRGLYGDLEPRATELNWALKLVRALAAPGFAGLLILIGLSGIYIELKTPGVGVGGFVAAVAFLLFFWSKYLDQTATWLEALLFLSGLVFLLMEAFVLPGFGIFGLGGGLLVIFSLVLASQTFVLPRSPGDLAELRRSVSIVAAAAAGLMGVAVIGRRLLPHAPLFNRLMLEPPAPAERSRLSAREMTADFRHLLGSTGVTQTDLRPAGKALVGGALCDVMAEGDWIDRGTEVVVVAAHANRVVVRPQGSA